MSLFEGLQTVAQVNATRRAQPKGAEPSRLQAKVKADKDDAKALEQWKQEVRARDENRCRCCGVKVVRAARSTS